MTNLIETVCDPGRLVLAWQAPDHLGERYRWAVGEISLKGPDCILRYFDRGEEFERFNSGRNYRSMLALGYEGYPAFNPLHEVHTQGVLAAFMRRVPPRSRSDFAQYRSSFRLSPKAVLTEFSLLAVTEAKLPSDGFSLVDTLDPEISRCDLYLEVAGFRYWGAKLSFLSEALEEPVLLVQEPDNKFDPNAVSIHVRDARIGYINRLQAPTFVQWMSEGRVVGSLEHLNGTAERPRAYIFVRVYPRKSASRAA